MSSPKQIYFAPLISLFASAVFAKDQVLSPQFATCEENSGISDPALLNCLVDERDRQDDKLNKTYKKFMSFLTPTQQKELRQTQRKWVEYTSLNCDFYATLFGDGWLARQEPFRCQAIATKIRTDELLQMIRVAK